MSPERISTLTKSAIVYKKKRLITLSTKLCCMLKVATNVMQWNHSKKLQSKVPSVTFTYTYTEKSGHS